MKPVHRTLRVTQARNITTKLIEAKYHKDITLDVSFFVLFFSLFVQHPQPQHHPPLE